METRQFGKTFRKRTALWTVGRTQGAVDSLTDFMGIISLSNSKCPSSTTCRCLCPYSCSCQFQCPMDTSDLGNEDDFYVDMKYNTTPRPNNALILVTDCNNNFIIIFITNFMFC
uniref:Uncharacterized protein n=1 Tax=Sipha flava TaxID=143950 RepID=A0A2S2Q7B2_9HEMI